MAEPITNRDREQVRRLHAEGKSRNAIARATGRSAATVSKIAREEGLTFSGGARVAAATEARRADAAARRELLADEALDGALGQVARAAGAETARDARDHATAARALTEVHARVAELSRDSGHSSTGGSMLDRLADALLGPAGGDSGEG
ncbi:helix-turn-helix domain-containing protein [Streptomyces malaysiensis]|uniref:Helix-turn-helix domain-containing protein n=1 Tax=Streptomyces malaysiensis subsp. samsunensis TaxID=459658 RepID=A0A9X2LU83_STRMQ|nr:helix-turn-helix domain-containing protein [Streptomyces samsunensis]MCQ8829848.1 helix-turn-helix domain-containing protein [Streptomyces samsunensis]